jgi:hypothetical protein
LGNNISRAFLQPLGKKEKKKIRVMMLRIVGVIPLDTVLELLMG